MRFVASTILYVAILAFVAQSVSAVPTGSTKDVDEVNQESNVLLKRIPIFDEASVFADCIDGIVPPGICYELFGPGPR